VSRCLAFIEERVQQCGISQFCDAARAGNRETSWIEEADLHEHTRLIPYDVLVGDLVAFDADDYDEHRLDPFPGWLESGQHPVHFAGVRERDNELIDEPFLRIGSRDPFERDVRRKELAD